MLAATRTSPACLATAFMSSSIGDAASDKVKVRNVRVMSHRACNAEPAQAWSSPLLGRDESHSNRLVLCSHCWDSALSSCCRTPSVPLACEPQQRRSVQIPSVHPQRNDAYPPRPTAPAAALTPRPTPSPLPCCARRAQPLAFCRVAAAAQPFRG